jgi:hypothetical protein
VFWLWLAIFAIRMILLFMMVLGQNGLQGLQLTSNQMSLLLKQRASMNFGHIASSTLMGAFSDRT